MEDESNVIHKAGRKQASKEKKIDEYSQSSMQDSSDQESNDDGDEGLLLSLNLPKGMGKRFADILKHFQGNDQQIDETHAFDRPFDDPNDPDWSTMNMHNTESAQEEQPAIGRGKRRSERLKKQGDHIDQEMVDQRFYEDENDDFNQNKDRYQLLTEQLRSLFHGYDVVADEDGEGRMLLSATENPEEAQSVES